MSGMKGERRVPRDRVFTTLVAILALVAYGCAGALAAGHVHADGRVACAAHAEEHDHAGCDHEPTSRDGHDAPACDDDHGCSLCRVLSLASTPIVLAPAAPAPDAVEAADLPAEPSAAARPSPREVLPRGPPATRVA